MLQHKWRMPYEHIVFLSVYCVFQPKRLWCHLSVAWRGVSPTGINKLIFVMLTHHSRYWISWLPQCQTSIYNDALYLYHTHLMQCKHHVSLNTIYLSCLISSEERDWLPVFPQKMTILWLKHTSFSLNVMLMTQCKGYWPSSVLLESYRISFSWKLCKHVSPWFMDFFRRRLIVGWKAEKIYRTWILPDLHNFHTG
jgi:hypothetical protein